MFELATVISGMYESLNRMATHNGVVSDRVIESLMSELSMQISQIESGTADLWQENFDLKRQLIHGETSGENAFRQSAKFFPPKTDVRQTMRMVSEFYERSSKVKPPQANAA